MPAAIGFSLFDTAIGPCGIAWTAEGAIAGLQLPEWSAERSRSRLGQRFPGAVEAPGPEAVAAVTSAIVALLGGEARELSGVALDMAAVPDFNRRVYDVARAIPAGRTVTYGEIARQLGDPQAARDVGQALGRNPFPIVVPCHRVVAAGGKLGGFSARGGSDTKRRMLAIERARVGNAPDLFG